MQYYILLIICGENVSLFHVFTFIPKKLLRLPAFMRFHRIHVYTLAKNFHGCKVICKNVNFFTANNKQYNSVRAILDSKPD